MVLFFKKITKKKIPTTKKNSFPNPSSTAKPPKSDIVKTVHGDWNFVIKTVIISSSPEVPLPVSGCG